MSSDANHSRATANLMGAVAVELLSEAAKALAPHQIFLMPLKGILLQRLVYEEPWERPMVDVDVAVRSTEFVKSCEALVQAGFTVANVEPGSWGISLARAPFPLCLDLHRRLAGARRFRLAPDAMFLRGARDDQVFGFPVVLPDPYDLYAHLLAHTTLDYVTWGSWHRPADLSRVALRKQLEPRVCAERLVEHGLGRLALVALAPGGPWNEEPFARGVFEALEADSQGRAIAAWARKVLSGDGPSLLPRRLLGLLLNPTLGEAGLAAAEAALVRLRRGNPFGRR